MRQLYIKLKDLIHKIAGKYHGPWDYILLRDTDHPENIYKVYSTEGNLRSNLYNNQFEVTFDANGGKFANDEPTYMKVYDNMAEIGEIPDVEFVFNRPGDFADDAHFDGWYTEPTGGEKITSTTKVVKDTTYYAHWSRTLFYETIGNELVKSDAGEISGFSQTSYLRLIKDLNLNYPFDIVVNATTSDELVEEQEALGCAGVN